jgi:cysteinyl-tRNA synthetase
MDDDFNTGAAIGDLFELVRVLNRFSDQHQLEDPDRREPAQVASCRRAATTLRELTAVLGLFRKPHAPAIAPRNELVGKLLDLLVDLRSQSRRNKDFATADRIRDCLSEIGVTLQDRKDGTHWRISE